MRAIWAALVVLLALLAPLRAGADAFSALARLDPERSSIQLEGEALVLDFALSQSVPWRVRVLDNPPRLILDTREVDWTGAQRISHALPQIRTLRAGIFRAGWSRLLNELEAPLLVRSAEMRTGDAGASIRLRLGPATMTEFQIAAALPEPPEWLCRRPPMCRRPRRGAPARWSWCWTPAMAALIPVPKAMARKRPI